MCVIIKTMKMYGKSKMMMFLLTIIIVSGLSFVNPNQADAGFFSFIKSVFTKEKPTPDSSQNPEEQKKQFTKEQKKQQEDKEKKVEDIKKELSKVKEQIFQDSKKQQKTKTIIVEKTINSSNKELKALEVSLLSKIADVEKLARYLARANFNAIALTNKLDSLTGVSINNGKITGTLTGLTDAHIPDDITVSNYLDLSSWFATTTDQITEGSSNLYWTNSRFDTRLSTTTTLPNLTTLLGLTNASTTQLTATGPVYFNSSTTLNGVEYLYPSSDGTSNQVLSTDGGGGLSWSTIATGESANWQKETNYGGLTLTPTTTIPLWSKGAIYASSTLNVQGQTTLGNASTTQITVTDSAYIGSITGVLQGVGGLVSSTSTISSSYIEDSYLKNNANDTTTGQLTAANIVTSSASATSTFAGGIKLNKSGTGVEFQDSTVQTTAFPMAALSGYSRPGKFKYSNTTTITIDPSTYQHSGTKNQFIYWDSTLTFVFGSAGSNSGSTNLGATTWYYLYIDDSAVATAGTNLITASELIAVSTAPTYNASKHGWYNGNDRVIGAFRTNGSSQLELFSYRGEGWFYWDTANPVNTHDFAAPGTATTPTTVSPDVPVGTDMIQMYIFLDNVAHGSGQSVFLYNDGGTSWYQYIGFQQAPGAQMQIGTEEMPLDSNRQMQYKVTAGKVYLHTQAYRVEY
jgi:hypothetical protein